MTFSLLLILLFFFEILDRFVWNAFTRNSSGRLGTLMMKPDLHVLEAKLMKSLLVIVSGEFMTRGDHPDRSH